MHSTTTPDDRTPGRACGPSTDDPRSAAGRASAAVPRQGRGAPDDGRLRDTGTDPLEHPDPYRAAQAAAVENLLRCWVRETGLPAPDNGMLRIPLPASGTALLVPVLHWSPTGWHRFGPPRLDRAPEPAPPADAVLLAALLGRESTGVPEPAPTGPRPGRLPGPPHSAGTSAAGPTAGLPPATAPGIGDVTDLASCDGRALRTRQRRHPDRRNSPLRHRLPARRLSFLRRDRPARQAGRAHGPGPVPTASPVALRHRALTCGTPLAPPRFPSRRSNSFSAGVSAGAGASPTECRRRAVSGRRRSDPRSPRLDHTFRSHRDRPDVSAGP
ncbi:hypothetical protein SGRIM128S_02400 [Streptomyces griseomycini]